MGNKVEAGKKLDLPTGEIRIQQLLPSTFYKLLFATSDSYFNIVLASLGPNRSKLGLEKSK